MTAWLLSGLGLLILLLAGDALVRGAVNLSLRLGVPALIISQTIPGMKLRKSTGGSQPPRNISEQSTLRRIMAAYSPRKKRAKVMAE